MSAEEPSSLELDCAVADLTKTIEIEGLNPFPKDLPAAEASLSELQQKALIAILTYAKENDIDPRQIGVMSDIDGTLRATLNYGLAGKFGGMSEIPLQPLRDAETLGIQVLGFATNNPAKDGHQIAQILGPMRGYRTIKQVLSEVFPNAELWAPGAGFLFRHAKRQQAFQESAASDILNTRQLKSLRLLVMIGDRWSDKEFLDAVAEVIRKDRKFQPPQTLFIKLPSILPPNLAWANGIIP